MGNERTISDAPSRRFVAGAERLLWLATAGAGATASRALGGVGSRALVAAGTGAGATTGFSGVKPRAGAISATAVEAAPVDGRMYRSTSNEPPPASRAMTASTVIIVRCDVEARGAAAARRGVAEKA